MDNVDVEKFGKEVDAVLEKQGQDALKLQDSLEEDDASELVEPQEQEEDDNAENIESDDDSAGDPTISNELLQKAVLAGMELSEAQKYTDPELLERMVNRLSGNKQPQQEDTADGDAEPEDDDILSTLPALNADDYDPEVVKAVEVLTNAVKSLQGTVKQLKTERQEALAEGTQVWFDAQIAALGSDYEQFVGKGGKKSLSPESKEFTTRGQIAQRMDILKAGYQSVGGVVPDREALFQEAVNNLLGSEVQKNKLNKTLASRAKQHVNRADTQHPVKKAGVRSVSDKIAAEIDRQFFSN